MDNSPKPESERVTVWQGDETASPGTVPGAALIGKGFRLIDIIGAAPGLVTVPELVKATGWPRPTLYRILAAVTAHGFVRYDPVAQGYTLGYRFLELAQNVWAAPDLAAVASIELQSLRDMTGETAYLAVPQEGAVMALGKFESPHEVRSAARLGVRKPMHCTSQGKAILAFLADQEVDALLGSQPLERFTPHTITDPEYLKAQLRIVRSRGYAIEDQEILLGNRCVGAPILDSTGRPVAAISVAGPIYRLTNERVDQLGPEIANVARHIGLKLRGTRRRRATSRAGSQAHPAQQEPAFYGAHPVWDSQRSRLLWVDRLGPSLHMTTDTHSTAFKADTDAPIDALMIDRKGAVNLLSAGRLIYVGDKGGAAERSVPELTGIRAIATGPDGQAWAAISRGEETAVGPITFDGEFAPVWSLRAEICALASSRNGEVLYASDAQRGTIYILRRDDKSVRVLNRIPRVSGEPRSLAVDAEDRLWVGLYDGWSVAQLNAEGEIGRLLALPVPRPTGLAFGGVSGETMFVTTARFGLARDVLEHAHLSGHLLVAHTDRAGWFEFGS